MNSIKSYSGLSNFNVVAVNPTMQELHAMDIKVKQPESFAVQMIEYAGRYSTLPDNN